MKKPLTIRDTSASPMAKRVTRHLAKADRMSHEAMDAAKADADLADVSDDIEPVHQIQADTPGPIDNAPCLPQPSAACLPAATPTFGEKVRGFVRRYF